MHIYTWNSRTYICMHQTPVFWWSVLFLRRKWHVQCDWACQQLRQGMYEHVMNVGVYIQAYFRQVFGYCARACMYGSTSTIMCKSWTLRGKWYESFYILHSYIHAHVRTRRWCLLHPCILLLTRSLMHLLRQTLCYAMMMRWYFWGHKVTWTCGQMVWASTATVGCGMSKSASGETLVVCEYGVAAGACMYDWLYIHAKAWAIPHQATASGCACTLLLMVSARFPSLSLSLSLSVLQCQKCTGKTQRLYKVADLLWISNPHGLVLIFMV
jgi:hypothetical protein